MGNEEESKTLNVRDWMIISTTLIGAMLTILALIWGNRPTTGIFTITLLLMLSFALLTNAVSSNSKANYLAKLEGSPEDARIRRFVKFAEYSFGLAFTFLISGFAILAYKYLLDFIGRNVIVLILPLSFLITAWILIFIYNIINYSGKALKALRSLKRNIWIFMELVCLGLIVLDFYQVIVIP